VIKTAQEFVELRTRNDERATRDSAHKDVWFAVMRDYPEFKEWIAHNKTVPLSVLRMLAVDPDPRVRFMVAMKRTCPPEILKQLARDEDETVRARVVYNEKTPTAVLDLMKQDASPLVAEALASRFAGGR
jgi:hypothetical protein